jgi:hypothetical protein
VISQFVGASAALEVDAAGAVAGEPATGGLTSDEESEIEDHLRGLGYVE